MCWQLRGKRQESGGELELGFDQDCPSPPFLFLWGFYFPLSFCFSPFSAMFGGPWGERKERRGLPSSVPLELSPH